MRDFLARENPRFPREPPPSPPSGAVRTGLRRAKPGYAAAGPGTQVTSAALHHARIRAPERGDVVRGHVEVLEREPRDIPKGRRGNDAAEDLPLRLVDRHQDDQPGRARGDDPDERRNVLRVRVAAG